MSAIFKSFSIIAVLNTLLLSTSSSSFYDGCSSGKIDCDPCRPAGNGRCCDGICLPLKCDPCHDYLTEQDCFDENYRDPVTGKYHIFPGDTQYVSREKVHTYEMKFYYDPFKDRTDLVSGKKYSVSYSDTIIPYFSRNSGHYTFERQTKCGLNINKETIIEVLPEMPDYGPFANPDDIADIINVVSVALLAIPTKTAVGLLLRLSSETVARGTVNALRSMRPEKEKKSHLVGTFITEGWCKRLHVKFRFEVLKSEGGQGNRNITIYHRKYNGSDWVDIEAVQRYLNLKYAIDPSNDWIIVGFTEPKTCESHCCMN